MRDVAFRDTSRTIDILERALTSRSRVVIDDAERRAAVSVVLNPVGPESTLVLLIQRTQRPDDPWSGQISFPGGRLEPEDPGPLEAAIREAHEEVGLDLSTWGRLIGQSDDQRAMARGRPLNLVITPAVFALSEIPQFRLQASEVDDVLWAPVEEMASGRLDGVYRHQRLGQKGLKETLKLPCYTVDGKVIWGLTYMMLFNLFKIIERFGQENEEAG